MPGKYDLEVPFTSLGNSGLRVSKVILGAGSYGLSQHWPWVLEETEALPLIKACYDAGIRTWDTADRYSFGVSEQILGKALKKYQIPRKKVVILSKCHGLVPDEDPGDEVNDATPLSGEYANEGGLSRKHIFDAVDASLERLQTPYMDVLQIHRLDQSTPKAEIMEALHDIVKSGKVRYIGASSMWAWEFAELQHIAELRGWTKFISMQNYHNLLYREEEREMNPFCIATGVGLMAWSPNAQGALARPLAQIKNTARGKSETFDTTVAAQMSDADKMIINRTEEVAKRLNVPMAQVSIAWSISKGMIPIVGISKMERLDDTCKACKLQLSEEDIKYLDEPYLPKAVEAI